MDFCFTVLGCGAAAPTKEHNPSSFLINHNKKLFLIDCGEGTQMQCLRFGIKYQKINHIFISHLHGDHFFGLVGLISTMHLLGRTKDLHIYCPRELEQIIQIQLDVSHSELRYKIHYHYLNFDDKQLIFQNSNLNIYSFPLEHKIPTCGFIFEEKPKPRKLIKDLLPHWLNLEQISQLMEGNDIFDSDGNTLFKNSELTKEPEKALKFAYCSDTKTSTSYKNHIKGTDMLYHETTFLDDLDDRANATHHSTALKVGKLAKETEINQLIIGHFSARYKNLATFIAEAQQNHQNVQLSEEGKTYFIRNAN